MRNWCLALLIGCGGLDPVGVVPDPVPEPPSDPANPSPVPGPNPQPNPQPGPAPTPPPVPTAPAPTPPVPTPPVPTPPVPTPPVPTPGPNPNPNPTPDPTPNPNPTPDPTPNPNPTPDPTPNPNPTPDPTPNPTPTPPPPTPTPPPPTPTPVPPTCADDVWEDNDSITGASVATGLQDAIIVEGDDDYWRINVPRSKQVRVNALHDYSDVDLDMKLLNSVGTELDSSTSFTDNEDVLAVNPTDADTSLYARVFNGSFFAECGPYQLETLTSCWIDDFEPNNSLNDAEEIEPGIHRLGVQSGGGVQDDWFEFEAIDESSYTFTLDFEHDFGDLDIQLFESDGVTPIDCPSEAAPCIQRSIGTGDQEVVRFTNDNLVFNIDIVIRVRGFDIDECTNYDMTITRQIL